MGHSRSELMKPFVNKKLEKPELNLFESLFSASQKLASAKEKKPVNLKKLAD